MRKKKTVCEINFKLPKCMFLVWLKGFINGRTKTATLNSENIVQSGYIQMYQKRFEEYTAKQTKIMDTQMHALSSEAEKLLLELKELNKPFACEYASIPENASVMQKRAVERNNEYLSNQVKSKSSRKKKIHNQLIEIRTQFSEIETMFQENLLETAAGIEAVLANYCKGVLFRKPLSEQNIQKMSVSNVIKEFHENVEWTARCLKHIDEEVNRNYEK
ncbi:MAG: hypothetical protein IKJ01_05390 [Lachnospiraceae bacterium]|nr:hypothetical protein [Lachnospiraceae bacterium]